MVTATAGYTRQSSAWWLLLLHGIAALLLGLMLVSAPAATLASLMTFIGFFWLISGVLSVVRVFVDRSVPWIWSLLSGIVGILAGLFVVNHPLTAALVLPATLVVILGIDGLAMGVFEIVRGVKGGGIGAFVLGGVNSLIGVLLLARPFAAALAVPFIFGVILLIEGVGLIFLAFKARRHET
jgi:uncharacterized membrane protein HdeD (DUF308 family)